MALLDLICIGEFYSDFIFYGLDRVPELGEEVKTEHFLRSPGGGAPITALTARRLGLRVGLVTVVGSQTARADLAPLKEAGVETAYSLIHPSRPTGITVSVSTITDRFFLTCTGANRDLERLLPADLFSYCARARHVHLALLPRNFARWTALCRRLAACKITTSWDHGWNPDIAAKRGARALLRAVTIFLANRTEGEHWTGQRRPEAALEALARYAALPVLKLGACGAAAWERNPSDKGHPGGRMILAPAERIRGAANGVETTGAGDAFNAGFLAAFIGGARLKECLLRGNQAAAQRVAAQKRK
ncbi:MAG TPA: PfkB family carbohydrate kinase [Bryobacterales bacterium]|jgi:ribokinase|nr:PfkB family carbohydrate kinase [Bryobacterales bacterium]